EAHVGSTMKNIAIQKIHSFFYTDSEEIESCRFEEKLSGFDQELETLLNKYGLEKVAIETSFYGLEKYSICKCENCQHLMVNRDKNPAGFSENDLAHDIEFVIYNGGEHDGKALCEECLPVAHRWGLHS
ncbi:hypothetical protein, partial [Desulfatiferula olefinivorans]